MAKKGSSSFKFDDILSNEKTKDEFCTWFWENEIENGKNLIDALNSSSERPDCKIRMLDEKAYPHIYCIVSNNDNNPGKYKVTDKRIIQWKYCKVGITEQDTTTGTKNRMETLKKDIIRETGKDASIIFVQQVKGTDSTKNKTVETNVRKRVGWPVHKDLAKESRLPVSTEWVITTQSHIDIIKKKIKMEDVHDTARFLEIVPEFQEDKTYLPKNPSKLPDDKMAKRKSSA